MDNVEIKKIEKELEKYITKPESAIEQRIRRNYSFAKFIFILYNLLLLKDNMIQVNEIKKYIPQTEKWLWMLLSQLCGYEILTKKVTNQSKKEYYDRFGFYGIKNYKGDELVLKKYYDYGKEIWGDGD